MIPGHRHILQLFLLIIIGSLVWAGCSKKKNGITNRVYHQTTARFNGYFNAKEIILALEEDLIATHQENWDELLPVFVYPTQEKSQSLYPELDLVEEKCSKVINRHSMRIRNKEHNKWIDDNYFLIGKANFYKKDYGKAQEMFTYVSKAYKDQDTRYSAGLWLARVYMERDQISKTNAVLKRLQEDKTLPKSVAADLPAVYADYFIRQENWGNAIDEIHKAISLSKDKQFRIRLTFILAQLYDKMNDYQRAIMTFERVVKMAPPYEMEFNAKLYQAYAHHSRLDPDDVRKLLSRMLRDEKNLEYRDQIYYAMADVELKHNNDEKAIEYLTESTRVSTNPKQKAKSFIRLAELYFVERQYVNARNYYDSTLTVISEDAENYLEVKGKAESLAELVDHIFNVELQDSLIAMVNLPEKEREKKILKMIADLEAEEERKRQARESDQIGTFSKQDQQQQVKTGLGGSGDWYFYNNTTRSHGFNEFRRVWGTRKLEDNWRRTNKQSEDIVWDDDGEGGIDGSNAEISASNVASLEEYLKGLPLNDTALVAAHNSLIKSQYHMGVIYREKLHDDDNAIEAFTRIILEYDTSHYALVSHYQLYRLYIKKEQTGSFFGSGMRDNSEYYKNVILTDHPDSKYAELIRNPNYGEEQSQKLLADRELYESTYTQYRRRQYNEALYTCNTVISEQPDNYLIPKFYLLKAMVIAQKKEPESYKATLREIIANFPGTEEAVKAKELLGAIGESISEPAPEKQQEEEIVSEDKEKPEASPYVYDAKASHFFAMVFPNKGVDANKLKADISDFNNAYFRNKDIKVTNSFINSENQILILRSFSDVADAMDYYNTFVKNNTNLKPINEQDFKKFVISTKNFTTLFKQKDVPQYMEFYTEQYLKSQ